MLKPITFALLVLAALIGFYGTALAQTVPVPPQPAAQPAPAAAPAPQPVPTPRPQTYVAPAPFSGLYNVISGQQPAAPGAPRPLTPFNTQPLP